MPAIITKGTSAWHNPREFPLDNLLQRGTQVPDENFKAKENAGGGVSMSGAI
jgi:hypothetical protein